MIHATNATAEGALRTTYSLSNAGFTVDAASVVYSEGGNRFRLPKNAAAYDAAFASGWPREAHLSELPGTSSQHRHQLHLIAKLNDGRALAWRQLLNIFDGWRTP